MYFVVALSEEINIFVCTFVAKEKRGEQKEKKKDFPSFFLPRDTNWVAVDEDKGNNRRFN